MVTMHAKGLLAGDLPAWQAGADQRLRFSMVLATALVAAALTLFRMPAPGRFAPLLELVVELARPQPVTVPEPEAIPAPPIVPPQEPAAEQPLQRGAIDEPAPSAASSEDGVPADWEALRDEAIREVLDAAAREQHYSVNPPFERARAEAAVRFRASLAPGERHIWDNVEKDQLGRTILRDGNCFHVLDDPNVTNRYAFETFDQYTVYCEFAFARKKGEELPWVDIIRERYPYLRDPVAIP